jgi:hypothetical protein
MRIFISPVDNLNYAACVTTEDMPVEKIPEQVAIVQRGNLGDLPGCQT